MVFVLVFFAGLFGTESRAQDSTAVVQILGEIGRAKKTDSKLITRAVLAIEMAQKTGLPGLEIRSRLLTAVLFEKNQEYNRSIFHFRKAGLLAEKVQSSTLGRQILPGIGRLHLKNDRPDSALIYFRRAFSFTSEDKAGRAAVFSELGNLYFESGKIDSAEYAFSQSIRLQELVNSRHNFSEEAHKLAEIFKITYRYDSAAKYLLPGAGSGSEKKFTRAEAGLSARKLAEIYYLKNEYDSAFTLLEKAEEFFGDEISETDKGELNLLYGLIFSKIRDFKKASVAFDSARLFFRNTGLPATVYGADLKIAEAKWDSGADADALFLFQTIRNRAAANRDKSYRNALLHFTEASLGIAEIMLKRGATDAAKKVLIGIPEAARKINYPDHIARAEIAAGLLAAENKKSKQAVSHAEMALHYARLTGFVPFKAKIYTKAAEIFGLSGHSRRSVEMYRQAAMLTDNYRQILTDRKIAQTKMSAEIRQKQQEVEMFRQKDEISQKIINNQQIITVLVVLVLLSVSGFALFINRSKRQITTSNQKLLEQKTELAAALDRQKQLQSRLVQSEKTGTLGMITAAVAHEINNPVNFVSGGAESLRYNFEELFELVGLYAQLSETTEPISRAEILTDLTELLELDSLETRKSDVGEMLEGISHGAGRITEVVQALQMFVRADETASKRMDLHKNLDACLFILKNQIFEKAVLEKDFADNLPEIEASPAEINQVFVNLTTNAIHAMQGMENGILTVRTRLEDEKTVSVSFKDTGKGIPPEFHERIFEPLFSDNSEQKSGLGLTVVKEVLDRSGGRISLVSGPGRGSEFIVYLPVYDA